MKNSSKKKSLLATATALMPTGVTMLVRGQQLEGGILIALSVGMILAYDHFDDKVKIPEGVDKETFVQLSELGADGIRDLADKYKSQKQNDSE